MLFTSHNSHNNDIFGDGLLLSLHPFTTKIYSLAAQRSRQHDSETSWLTCFFAPVQKGSLPENEDTIW